MIAGFFKACWRIFLDFLGSLSYEFKKNPAGFEFKAYSANYVA